MILHKSASDLLENAAYKKPASQSSTYYQQNASLAVDGRIHDGSCTNTVNSWRVCKKSERSPVAWWQVDLGEVSNISAIWLANRLDRQGKTLFLTY